MPQCQNPECQATVRTGYTYLKKFRCVRCHEDFIRRSTRQDSSVIPTAIDRHRKTKQGIYE